MDEKIKELKASESLITALFINMSVFLVFYISIIHFQNNNQEDSFEKYASKEIQSLDLDYSMDNGFIKINKDDMKSLLNKKDTENIKYSNQYFSTGEPQKVNGFESLPENIIATNSYPIYKFTKKIESNENNKTLYSVEYIYDQEHDEYYLDHFYKTVENDYNRKVRHKSDITRKDDFFKKDLYIDDSLKYSYTSYHSESFVKFGELILTPLKYIFLFFYIPFLFLMGSILRKNEVDKKYQVKFKYYSTNNFNVPFFSSKKMVSNLNKKERKAVNNEYFERKLKEHKELKSELDSLNTKKNRIKINNE